MMSFLYDYPQAQSLLAQAKRHYPDSVALSTIEDQVKEQRDQLMETLDRILPGLK